MKTEITANLDQSTELGFETDKVQLARLFESEDRKRLAAAITGLRQLLADAREEIAERTLRSGSEVEAHVAGEVLPAQERAHRAGEIGDPHSVNWKPGGRRQPRGAEVGNLVHYRGHAEALGSLLGGDNATIPKEFEPDFKSGKIITLDLMPKDLRSEVWLGYTVRADRVEDKKGAVIFEIKPNTASSIREGLIQLDEYVRLSNARKRGGRSDWKGFLVVYDDQGRG